MKKLLISFVLILGLVTSVSAQDSDKKLTVLITGANRGIGLEFAKQFSEKGYKVIGTARSPEKADDLKATGAEVMKLDVTSEKDIAALAESLKGKKIDILLNNAGYFGPKRFYEGGVSTFETITREELEDCMRVNAYGPLFVSRALVPNLKLSDSPKIVNISSRLAIMKGNPQAWGYSVSKTALNRVVVNMDAALRKDGFIVIALGPGHNKTDMGGLKSNGLEPKVTVGKMVPLIEGLTKKQSGTFLSYTGEENPW